MRKHNLLSVLLIFFQFSSSLIYAQNYGDKSFYLIDSLNLDVLSNTDKLAIDSILQQYHQTKEDTTKLNLLSHLISVCENGIWTDYNHFLLKSSSELLEKTSNNCFKKHQASAYNNFGFYHYNRNEIEKAIDAFEKAIKLSKEINNLSVIPTALNNLGYIYKQQGDILRALELYHQALKLNQKLNEKEEIALSLNNIGSIYFYQKEYEKALKYYRDALLIEKEHKSQKAVARLYSNIGSIYKEQKKYELAIEYFDQSIKIYQELKIQRGYATSLSKKTSIEFELLKDTSTSIHLDLLQNFVNKHKESFKIYNEIEDNEGKAFSLLNISLVYKEMGNLLLAEQYARQSIEIANEIGFPESIKNAADILKDVALSKQNYREAYQMQELYYQMLDSINSQSVYDATLQRQYQYEYEKKLIKDSLAIKEAEKIRELKYTQQIKTQKTYTIVGIIGFFLMLIVVLVVYRGYKLKKKSNLLLENKNLIIEEKNKEITDSITYAKRIQEAILPAPTLLNKHLKDGFILYKPKDIVAGDFYWMHPNNEEVLFAAADCTGHGVPGAMVSVVCHHALNRAVREYQLSDPGKILDKTREIVVETFAQNAGFNLSDGMDIALCSVNFKTNIIKYAGANNPFYLITTNESTIEKLPEYVILAEEYNTNLFEIKADKQPVGNYINVFNPFTTHTIQVYSGDMIYLFSDGFPDQFGGEKGKKLKYKYFKKVLMLNSKVSMNDQKISLNKFFHEWKGEMEQIDDICVIGVKI